MPAEPMEEDDSFNTPIARRLPVTVPYVAPRNVESKKAQRESDPDSDDSFETFAQTQTTSAKSSLSSTQSTEYKAPLPPRSPTAMKSVTGTQQTSYKPTISPQLPISRMPSRMCPSASSSGVSEVPKTIRMHPAVKTTKESELSQKSTSSGTPWSPNSLARHRSANSGLRNSQPPFGSGNRISVRTNSPIFESSRPATPSGDVLMLRDQLENKNKEIVKIREDFGKELKMREAEHHKRLVDKDTQIEEKKKEIEMLKSRMACQKSSSPSSHVSRTKSSTIMMPTTSSNNMNYEVKKLKPKIPMIEPSRVRTPRRPIHNCSIFKHPPKEGDEDTFAMDESNFEPSATSTPKIGTNIRTGIRRPRLEDDSNEAARGAPAVKRKPVRTRRQRNRAELNRAVHEMWNEIGFETRKNMFQQKEMSSQNQIMETDEREEDEQWLDTLLERRMEFLNVNKQSEKSSSASGKIRTKIAHQWDVRLKEETLCENCRVNSISKEKGPELKRKKKWETEEEERMELAERRAEASRHHHYTNLIHSLQKNGIEELEESSVRNESVEKEYQHLRSEVKKRTLEELRVEQREKWRTDFMRVLRENGEAHAHLDMRDTGKQDYLWTSDEEDEGWQFEPPYGLPKSTLCCDCIRRTKPHRRVVKRDHEKTQIRMKCLEEYGVEKLEQLRNMSILTKSRIEAADDILFRENNITIKSTDGAARFDDDEDMI